MIHHIGVAAGNVYIYVGTGKYLESELQKLPGDIMYGAGSSDGSDLRKPGKWDMYPNPNRIISILQQLCNRKIADMPKPWCSSDKN